MLSLNKDIYEDLINEVSKTREFKNVLKLILSSKEAFHSFFRIIKTIKAVKFDHDEFIFIFDSFSWAFNNFPNFLWNEVATSIPEIISDAFNADDFVPMLKLVERSKKLQKIDIKSYIKDEAWEFLMNTSVNEIAANTDSWIFIDSEELVNNLLKSVKVFFNVLDDQDLIMELLSTFDVPSENFIMETYIKWNVFLGSLEIACQSPQVKNLRINFYDLALRPMYYELRLPELLEKLPHFFTNLEKVEIDVKALEYEVFDYDLDTQIVNELTQQVMNANIHYKLDLQWFDELLCETSKIQDVSDKLKALNFVCQDTDGRKQKWSKEKEEIAKNKTMKIEFLVKSYVSFSFS